MISAQQLDQMWQGHTEIPAVVATGVQGWIGPLGRAEERQAVAKAIGALQIIVDSLPLAPSEADGSGSGDLMDAVRDALPAIREAESSMAVVGPTGVPMDIGHAEWSNRCERIHEARLCLERVRSL